ncbi:MAG: hypothetical protein AAGB93_14095 [Planctomycetota bacterium]
MTMTPTGPARTPAPGGGDPAAALPCVPSQEALDLLEATADAILDGMTDDELGLAVERYFGDVDVLFDHDGHPLGQRAVTAFYEWAMGDHRCDERAPTGVERALESVDFVPMERDAVEARRNAVLGIYRVEDRDGNGDGGPAAQRLPPGRVARLVDVTTGEVTGAWMPGLTPADLDGLHPLRLVELRRARIAIPAGPVLGASGVTARASELAAFDPASLSRRLRLEGRRLGAMWLEALDGASDEAETISSPRAP